MPISTSVRDVAKAEQARSVAADRCQRRVSDFLEAEIMGYLLALTRYPTFNFERPTSTL
jgi:hypothetical protein